MGKRSKDEVFDFSDIVDEEEFDFSDVTDPDEYDFSDVVDKPGEYDALGQAIESQAPILKPVYDLGRTIYSGLTDQAPQAVAQTLEVAKSSINPANINEYIRNKKSVDFQRYVKDKDPKYKGISGFFTAFDIDEAIPKYGKQFLEDEGLGAVIPEMEKNLPKVIERRKNLEEYVSLQKEEASEKLGGVVQDFRDINNVSDFGSYIGNLVGQAAYQIPLSAATRGGSSYIMEAATIYDKQLDRLAQENGISREEVIERNLDNPAAGQAYAIVASTLDAASAGNLIGAFRKSGGSLLKKWMVNAVPESVTEATQGVLEDVGSGGSVGEALSGEGLAARVNELAGGLVGGSVFSFVGKGDQKKAADQAINQVADTGNASLNAIIDAEAALTPEEEKIVKTNIAEEKLEEAVEIEEKLVKEKEQEEKKEAAEKKEPKPKEVTAEFEAETSKAVREIEDQIRNIQPDQDITELVTKLNEAKQERDNARIAFEKKKQSREEKTVHLTPSQAIKAQFESVTKGLKKGVKIGVEETNKLIDKARTALKEFNLSDKQRDAILTKVKNTDINAFGTSKRSVSALNQFIDNVSKDAEYAEKVNEVKTINKKLRKLSKVKNPNLQNNKSLAKAFVTIDPEDTFINHHLVQAKNILASMTSPKQGEKYQRLNESEVQSYILKLQEQVVEAQTKEDQEISEDESEEKPDVLKAKVRSSIKELEGKDLTDFDDSEKATIKALKSLDPERLDEKQLIHAIRVVDNIIENDSFINATPIEALIEAQNALDEIKPLLKGKQLGNPSNFYGRLTNSVSRAWDELIGNSTLAAKVKMVLGVQGLTNAGSRTENRTVGKTREVADIIKNFNKKTGKNALDVRERTKVTVYGLLIRHPENSDPDAHLPQMKANIEQTIEEWKIYGELERATAWQEAYDQVKDLSTAAEIESVWGKLNPEHKKLFDYFPKMFSELTEQHKGITEQAYNKPYIKETNYNTFDTKNINGKTAESFIDKTKNALTGVQRGSLKAQQSTTSLKATRKLSAGSVYSDDFFVNQLKAYSETLYDIESAKVKSKLYNVVNNPEFKEIFGRENAEFLTDQLLKTDMINQGLGGLPSDEFLQALNALVDVGRNLGAAYALGSTIGQVLKQTFPVILKGINVLASTGSLHLLPKVMRFRSPNVKKLHDQYSIGTAGLRLGGIERGNTISFNLSASAKKKAVRGLEKMFNFTTTNTHKALAFLTTSDRLVKQAFWNAYYLKRLSELGIKSVNMNEEWSKQNEPERQEAAAYAEHMVSVTQIPSNPGELSTISRKSGNQALNIIKNVILPFATYSMEAKARLVVNTKKAIRNPSWETWVGGVGGDLQEVALYSLIQLTIMREYKKQLENMWEWMFGLEDEEDEEKEEKKTNRRIKSQIAQGLNTINPLAIGTPGEEIFNRGMNRIGHAIYKIKENPDITYKKWKRETVGFAYEDEMDFGLLSIGYKPFVQSGSHLVDLVDVSGDDEITITDDFGNTKDVYLTQQQQNLLLVNWFVESLSMAGVNEADLFNSLRNTWTKQLKQATKEAPVREE